VSHIAEWDDVVCDGAGNIWVGGYPESLGTESFLVGRYSATGARVWRSAWKGPEAAGAACHALCFGKTGLLAVGVTTTAAGGNDALAVKYTK
jgi:hypothetical protein